MEEGKIKKISDFDQVEISLASPEDIIGWSFGEVMRPETINYRTQKFEKEGLFCEKIFGPSKDWECYCGKYKRIRYKGIVCDKCGVEVTRSIVRRERMGHIKLAVPVSHIWFLRGVPSRIGLILGLSLNDLEKVVYFASYIVTNVDDAARKESLGSIENEYKNQVKKTKDKDEKEKIKEVFQKNKHQLQGLVKNQILSEVEYYDYSRKYGQVFEASIGAEAINKLLSEIDLKKEIKGLRENLESKKMVDRKKILKRLRLLSGFLKNKTRPEWMMLKAIPIIPPDLRPMVQLDGGRFATSDLNDLYRRIINRNNRLKKLIDLGAPEVIQRNEKRMLQEAVDALIDNSSRKSQTQVAASTGQRRPLKSVADMLKGKQGRFRQNLLGKRVDYSGRSVIVVGPELSLDQCGLPKKMALELFKPFIINKLIEKEYAHNVRIAGRMVDAEAEEAYEILDEIISNHYVLLNRAPTLHRLSIQAFRPILIEGKAIRVHPLVCAAFNADFDGDQMAVHVPLTKKARKECEEIMLSSKNLLKPSSGEPITTPSQDIVLGVYYMTKADETLRKDEKEMKKFISIQDVIRSFQMEVVELREEVVLYQEDGDKIVTTAGRALLNDIFPDAAAYNNECFNKGTLKRIIAKFLTSQGSEETVKFLDKLKNLGFRYATGSGISLGIDDLNVPESKKGILDEGSKRVEEINEQFDMGLLTDEERKSNVVEVWNEAKGDITEEVKVNIDKDSSIFYMIDSKARGSDAVVVQMAGMKGLVAGPTGETMELPIKSSFKEGFNVLEYFISTHGARKGMADTALRTATAGYLTRRLVDVAQDVVIREADCGDTEGAYIYREDSDRIGQSFALRIEGRFVLENVINEKTKEKIVKKGEMIDQLQAEKIEKAGIEKIRIRNLVTCKTSRGVCQRCYGKDLGRNKLVDFGEAVGVVAAQAIGEPGTQLTMRTFHIGGVAGTDITQGLPRVDEIFEARNPKGEAIMAEFDGRIVDIKEDKKVKTITIEEKPDKNKKPSTKSYAIPSVMNLKVKEGGLVTTGQVLSEGHLDLKKLYKISGRDKFFRYIIQDVQEIYQTQGEGINDKHLEIIIRQMLSRLKVVESGDTELLVGDVVEIEAFKEANRKAKEAGGEEAKSEGMVLGISKVSLSTESFLSAASFQETAKVLINAATQSKVDHLRGLKENVIIGKLIPAGTGFREEVVETKVHAKA